MNPCSHLTEQLGAWVDGELPPEEARLIDAHATECAGCRQRAREIMALQAGVAELSRAELPADLEERLGRLVPQPLTAARRPRPLITAAAGIALVAVAVLLALTLPGRPATAPAGGQPFWRALVNDHLEFAPKADPAEVSSALPSAVEHWFRGRLPFDLRVPRLADARLLGGRRCTVSGHRVAMLFYEHQGRRISMFVLKADDSRRSLASLPEGRTGPSAVRCSRRFRGASLCVREMTGLGYVLVSEAPAARLAGLLDGALAPSKSN